MVSNFSMKRWAPDGESNYCSDCYEKFTLLNRKHHCRGCGRLLCHSCSNHWLLIPEDKIVTVDPKQDELKVPQRCCNSCANYLQSYQSDLRKVLSRSNHDLGIDRQGSQRYLNNPLSLQLQTDIRKATYTLYNFTSDNQIQGKDKIPKELIVNAKGIVFLTVMKAGFLLSARIGTGLVISRLDNDSWSAPSAISISGLGWGFQIGTELADIILILNTQSAVNAFSSNTQVSLGTELGVSIGPVGRSAGTDMHAGENGASAAFSYAHSKGLFAGISLEASVISTRSDVNRQFYGTSIIAADLLNGKEPQPKAAEPLYQALTEVLGKLLLEDNEGENKEEPNHYIEDCYLAPVESYMSSSTQDRNERLRRSKDDENMFNRNAMLDSVSLSSPTVSPIRKTNAPNSIFKEVTDYTAASSSSDDNYFDQVYEFDANRVSTTPASITAVSGCSASSSSSSCAEEDRNPTYLSFADMNTSTSAPISPLP